jgi:lysozyme family protein
MVALTDELRKEYRTLYASAQIRASRVETMKWYTNKIQRAQARYEAVSGQTGVPWWVIAVIHMMESSGNFGTHLHNGDSLNARTVHVPAGRPKNGHPPFSWEESACDALGYDGATGIKEWNLETTLWFLEAYNGWGYRTGAGRATVPPERSAYLWSYTDHYIRGRYVEDGHFDPMSVSDQAGVVAILKSLEARGLIKPLLETTPPPPGRRLDDVTWFELHRVEENGKCITGCVAMAAATPVATWAGIDHQAMHRFMLDFRNASHVLVAPSVKPWPGYLPKPAS